MHAYSVVSLFMKGVPVGIPEEGILHVKNVTNTIKIVMFSSCSQTGHSYEHNLTYIDGKHDSSSIQPHITQYWEMIETCSNL